MVYWPGPVLYPDTHDLLRLFTKIRFLFSDLVGLSKNCLRLRSVIYQYLAFHCHTEQYHVWDCYIYSNSWLLSGMGKIIGTQDQVFSPRNLTIPELSIARSIWPKLGALKLLPHTKSLFTPNPLHLSLTCFLT